MNDPLNSEGRSTSPLNSLLCEIEAKEKLIKYQKAYRLTEQEVETTKKLLEIHKKELEELTGGIGL